MEIYQDPYDDTGDGGTEESEETKRPRAHERRTQGGRLEMDAADQHRTFE